MTAGDTVAQKHICAVIVILLCVCTLGAVRGEADRGAEGQYACENHCDRPAYKPFHFDPPIKIDKAAQPRQLYSFKVAQIFLKINA